MTRAVIPVLKRNGVDAISIGANDGSTPPDVPPCFLWEDPSSGESVLALFNWPGYGSLPVKHQMTCLVDGFEHALVYNWNGDNAGPSSAADYAKDWAVVAATFPNAAIYASTLGNFTTQLATVASKLPVVKEELADSWVYGVPSDPQKVSRMRVMNRAWEQFAASKNVSMTDALAADPVFRNATRFALKLGEHTWGKDVKSNLYDNYNWKNADFHRAKQAGAKNASQYDILEASWWEQREWGITLAIDTLTDANHPLGKTVTHDFASLEPQIPSVGPGTGWEAGAAGDEYTCGDTQLAFDATGAISTMTTKGGRAWASASNTLLNLVYRSYSAADVASFFGQYCKSTASWVQHDYGKPGLPSDVQGRLWNTTLTRLFVKRSAASVGAATRRQSGQPSDSSSSSSSSSSTCEFAIQASFEAGATAEYGAAGGVWTTVQVDASTGAMSVSVGMFNKTQTRLPEAMFITFNPQDSSSSSNDSDSDSDSSSSSDSDSGVEGVGGVGAGDDDDHDDAGAASRGGLQWAVNKLGSWITPDEIVNGGSKHLHGISEEGIKVTSGDGKAVMHIAVHDAAVASFGAQDAGKPTAYPSPVNVTADTADYGSSVVLWDNLWGTNYIMWWPFEWPPPAEYSGSSKYFPEASNSMMLSRFTITVEDSSVV